MATTFVSTPTAANSQEWGEEEEEDAVYTISLKRVRYYSDNSAVPGDDEPVARLQWQTCKIRTIKAATIDKLIATLAPEEENIDPTYMQAFLCTYRSYTDAATVVEKLIARYRDGSTNGTGALIKRSVVSVLRTWMDLYPDDFNSPPYHGPLMALIRFIEEDLPEGSMVEVVERSRKLFDQFANHVGTAEIGQKEELDVTTPSRSYVDFMTLQPADIAYQLTILDSKLFCDVVPHHTMGCVWGKRNKAELAPTVHQTVQQFNRVSRLVTTSILFEGKVGQISPHQLPMKGPSARAKTVDRWLAIAAECRHLKNFSSLKAILSGLQSSPIHRLKRTWAVVLKDSKEAFDELSELFSEEKNQQNTRQLLMKEGTAKYSQGSKKRKADSRITLGVVPYLGTFLTDLMMIDTAYPSKVRRDLINFQKRRKEFEVLAQLSLFQKSAGNYALPEDKPLQEWLMSIDTLSEQESYELSCQVEPMESDMEANAQRSTPFTQKFRNLFGSKATGFDLDLSSSELPSPGTELAEDEANWSRSKTMPPSPRRRMSFDVVTGKSIKAERQSSSNSIIPPSLCIIRVALKDSTDTHCMYKSLLLNCDDRTPAVVAMALEKLGVDGLPQDFNLIQLVNSKKKLHIPDNCNVYYAIDTSTKDFRFVLERKQPERTSSQHNLLAIPAGRGHTRARSVSPMRGELASPEKMQSRALWMQDLPTPAVRVKSSRSSVDLSRDLPTDMQLFRPSESTCIIRVALDSVEQTACVYKSMLLTCNERTPAVVKSALEKLDIVGEPTDYDLIYVPDTKKRIVIPHDANVFYAVDNTSDSLKFLLSRKTDKPVPPKTTVKVSSNGVAKKKLSRHGSFIRHQSESFTLQASPGSLSVPSSPVKSCHSTNDLRVVGITSEIASPFGSRHVPLTTLPTSHIIRVAYRESAGTNCVYKSLLLSCNDHACSVIKASMEKLGLGGQPNDYVLVQEIDQKHSLRIPYNCNVFYAMSSSTDSFSFVLERRHQQPKDVQV